MKANIILQAVILMLIIAMAASCAASKEYATRVFSKPKTATKDSTAMAKVRFLEMDSLNNHPDMILVTLPGEASTEEGSSTAKTETPTPAPVKAPGDVARTKKTRD